MKYQGETLADRALRGDAEARGRVIEGLVGPVFDLSVHLHGEDGAESAARAALLAAHDALYLGSLPQGSPTALVVAVRALLAGAPPPAPIELFGSLDPQGARRLLVALVCDLDRDELASLNGPGARLSVEEDAARTGRSMADLLADLEAVAARVRLPSDLTDFLDDDVVDLDDADEDVPEADEGPDT